MSILPPATPDTAEAAAKAAQQRDALTYIKDFLREYDLPESLADWAWQQLVEGRSESEVTLSLYDRPEFDARYPVIKQRREAGLPAISAGEVLTYERTFRQVLQNAGMPSTFFDQPSDAHAFLLRDRSINEVIDAVNEGWTRVKKAPVEVRQAFSSFFGADGDNALAAFFLNPDVAMPMLDKATRAAEIGGQGLRFGVTIDRQRAERIADLGATQETAADDFRKLRELDDLFSESVSEDDDFTIEGIGVSSVLEGDATSTRRLQRRQQQRSANVAGGGGAAATQTGIIGLGKADQ